jgi:hypothetical protein
MMGLIRPVVAACLVCGMFLAHPARAESGGRITFSGAIVVPTCAAPVAAATLANSGHSSSRTFICGDRSQAAAGTADISSYELSVTQLGVDETTGSPLLQYYAGYLAAAHGGDARMVTRTYE